MAWVYLTIAGVLEVLWAFSMKKSEGFSLLAPTLITVVAAAASFYLLSLAMRAMPLGTAYMIWTGIGALGAFAVGVVALGETATPGRVVACALIAGGIVLMKLAGSDG